MTEVIKAYFHTYVSHYKNQIIRWPFVENERLLYLEQHDNTFYLNDANKLTKICIDKFLAEKLYLIETSTRNISASNKLIKQTLDILGHYTFSGGYQYGWKINNKKLVIDAIRFKITVENKDINSTKLIETINTIKTINTLKTNVQVSSDCTKKINSSQAWKHIQNPIEDLQFKIPKKYNYLFIQLPKHKRIEYQTCKRYDVFLDI